MARKSPRTQACGERQARHRQARRLVEFAEEVLRR